MPSLLEGTSDPVEPDFASTVSDTDGFGPGGVGSGVKLSCGSWIEAPGRGPFGIRSGVTVPCGPWTGGPGVRMATGFAALGKNHE